MRGWLPTAEPQPFSPGLLQEHVHDAAHVDAWLDVAEGELFSFVVGSERPVVAGTLTPTPTVSDGATRAIVRRRTTHCSYRRTDGEWQGMTILAGAAGEHR